MTNNTKDTKSIPLHTGHRLRIRERARKESLRNFTEHQILEYLLSFVVARKDTNDLAHILINEFGSLSNVLDAKYEHLIKTKGISEVSATFLSTLPQILDYYHKVKFGSKIIISNPQQTLNFIIPILSRVGNEHLIVVMLDNNNKLLHYEVFTMGESDKIKVKLSDVQSAVSKCNATKVILAHNHPTGRFSPSTADTIFTRSVFMCLSLLGIELLDHYIIQPDGSYYSFRQYGELDNVKGNLGKLIQEGL